MPLYCLIGPVGGSLKESTMGGDQVQITKDEVIYVLSLEEAQKLWLVEQEASGKLTAQAARELWEEWRRAPHAVAAYFATGSDIMLATKLAKDFGTMTGRVHYKTYGGKVHIILKGRPGLRSILTGTKYGVNNPKVVSMGLGSAGAKAAMRQGAVISIVLLTAYNVIDFVMSDQVTLMDLIGQTASDIVKVGISAGASIAAATVVGTTGLVASFALGPLVVAILVGVGTAMVLDAIDERYKLTERLKTYLNETARQVERSIHEAKRRVERSIIDLTADVLEEVAHQAGQAARRYILRKLRDITWSPSIPQLR